ncbi:hypothetical protein [Cohnella yongneupensis]|uniref:Uncharacterized protein n=1 Tax=Cohnella yongneupensis TaxID=425006 RepID=A0ABW0R5N8_9BACL
MEQLISFAMNNFFIVIIVVGILYQLFFRKSPLEKPRNRMPDFGGGQQRPRPPGSPPTRGVPMRTPEAKQEPRSPVTVRSAPPPEHSRPQPQPQPQPLAADDVFADKRIANVASHVSAAPKAAHTTAAQPGEGVTRDELARAVMWAEILGPPRARRPHGRS